MTVEKTSLVFSDAAQGQFFFNNPVYEPLRDFISNVRGTEVFIPKPYDSQSKDLDESGYKMNIVCRSVEQDGQPVVEIALSDIFSIDDVGIWKSEVPVSFDKSLMISAAGESHLMLSENDGQDDIEHGHLTSGDLIQKVCERLTDFITEITNMKADEMLELGFQPLRIS